MVIYPDPPLGEEELMELRMPGLNLVTPTTVDGKSLKGLTVGLSISTPPKEDMARLGLSEQHLKLANEDLAQHCLSRGASIAYGGDLRDKGFTLALFDLVRAQHQRGTEKFARILSFLAWPIYLDREAGMLLANNKDVAAVERIPLPQDLTEAGLADRTKWVDCDAPEHCYIWARSLTAMRERMMQVIHARVLLGGTLKGYKGKWPGLIEEALLALRAGMPLFLLGGFGGATATIIEALEGRRPEELTEEFQYSNELYEATAHYYNNEILKRNLDLDPIDYGALLSTFHEKGGQGLKNALNNGLTDDENRRLFVTEIREEAVRLVLKGLSNVKT